VSLAFLGIEIFVLKGILALTSPVLLVLLQLLDARLGVLLPLAKLLSTRMTGARTMSQMLQPPR
jgi:hypothetical protein